MVLLQKRIQTATARSRSYSLLPETSLHSPPARLLRLRGASIARPISWLPRLFAITRSVQGSVRSHYDRADLEALFELQPRAAQKLIEQMPSVAVGTSRLVAREALIAFLEGMAEAENPAAYLSKVRSRKAEVSRKKPRTLVRRDREPVTLACLPESVTLTRCRLEVSFRTLEDLTQSLYALAQAIEADGDEMVRLYELAPDAGPPVAEEIEDLNRMLAELEALEAACTPAGINQP